MEGKGYVNVSLDINDGNELIKILKIADIKCLTASKMHITIMYDKSNPEISMLPDEKTHTAKIIGIERLGEKGSKWEAIALILDCPSIEKRFKELKNAGYKHSYSEFKCHMSLLYGPEDTDLDKIELMFKLGVFPDELHFNNEKFEKLKD